MNMNKKNKQLNMNIIFIQESWCILPITKHPVMFEGFNNTGASETCPYQVPTITFWKSDTESFYIVIESLCVRK